ncbi:hypothetical protein PRO82_001637 [Candidatus Protochlamydia amoebophila]|nr:hypothetical protein [Candidatus Protochlamydia amoebophila]
MRVLIVLILYFQTFEPVIAEKFNKVTKIVRFVYSKKKGNSLKG